MLLACYSHKHISYRIRTIIRKAILSSSFSFLNLCNHFLYICMREKGIFADMSFGSDFAVTCFVADLLFSVRNE
ncbi:hypothetical protein [Wolbachia endosymbiont (group A) of Scambus nigricans]|uniref:hypothetical protein n=1 Tax=Wolbachia endosymbiont (group A) of Scambus nigricans TaxID=2954055 RepID=UPI002232C418|nr:hypothetical protein [Wolbachia endosymbiont (group A) of Scambus nigricans]